MISSLVIVGSPLWVPLSYAWTWNRWRRICSSSTDDRQKKKKRTIHATLLLSLLAIAAVGPYRSPRVGQWLRLKQWRLWTAWLKFVAWEVILDNPSTTTTTTLNNKGSNNNNMDIDITKDQVIFAISPHGIFPFSLGLAVLPEIASRVFGQFRPVVATATSLFPFLRTILSWLNAVDASRPAVDRALRDGSRIGLAPGGIAEMFEGYPKPSTHPDEEYVILNARKGFIRMAIQHGIPLVPVYCFGATKMFKRLQLPALEYLSKLLRISICVFFGSCGLPVPFRQRLLYVIGSPIFPPPDVRLRHHGGVGEDDDSATEFEKHVDALHGTFCEKLVDLFDRHKESYGWARKTLRVV